MKLKWLLLIHQIHSEGWVVAPSGKKYKPEECGVDGNGKTKFITKSDIQ